MTRILKSQARPIETVSLPSSAPVTLVIDGNYLLKCSYHATISKPEFNIGGRHIGVVHEYLRKVRWLVDKFQVTKCVVFWDGEHGGKLRHNIYPYYKANRKNKQWYRGPQKSEAQAQEDARAQRSIESQKVRVQCYLEELYVRQTEQAMMEADDMIAYYCQQFHQQERIIVFTNDRDLCQMLGLNGVSIYLDNLKVLLNRDNFDVAKFEYHYSNAALWKIILGDTSDNIKGVHQLGDKTLLSFFPEIAHRKVELSEVLERARQQCAERIAQKKKPEKKIQNLVDGVAIRLYYGAEEPHAFGPALYELNTQLMDLSQPMLTREAREEVLHLGTSVLDPGTKGTPSERGTVKLLPLMNQDHLLRFYSGDLRTFVQPFFPLVARERQLYAQNQA